MRRHGHTVIQHRSVLIRGAPDNVVCAAAIANDAILIAIDNDMKQLAKRYGVTPRGERFPSLNIIRLCCREALASKRLMQASSLILHEWDYARAKAARRLWVDIHPHFIRSNR